MMPLRTCSERSYRISSFTFATCMDWSTYRGPICLCSSTISLSRFLASAANLSYIVPDESRTIIFRSVGPRRSLSMTWTAIPPPINIGIIMMAIRNALVPTIARYSRAAITNILPMARVPHRLRFRPGNAYEDVVQRRPGQLEVLDPAAVQKRAKNRLRIGLMVHAQFGVAPVVVDPDHAGQIIEKGTGTICAKHPPGRSGKLYLSPSPRGRESYPCRIRLGSTPACRRAPFGRGRS